MFNGRLMPGGQALRSIDPLILAQSRTTISFLFLLPVLILSRGRTLGLPKKDLLQTAVLGILGVAASNYLYYLAIQKTNVAIAIIIQYTLASSAAFWMVVNPPWKIAAAHYDGGQWLFLLVFAVTSVLLPFSLYFAGLQHLEPTNAIVASCLEPVFSIIIAAIALGETMRPLQTLGIIIVLIAIVIVQMPDQTAMEATTLVEPIE